MKYFIQRLLEPLINYGGDFHKLICICNLCDRQCLNMNSYCHYMSILVVVLNNISPTLLENERTCIFAEEKVFMCFARQLIPQYSRKMGLLENVLSNKYACIKCL